jgi:hypothetical protein
MSKQKYAFGFNILKDGQIVRQEKVEAEGDTQEYAWRNAVDKATSLCKEGESPVYVGRLADDAPEEPQKQGSTEASDGKPEEPPADQSPNGDSSDAKDDENKKKEEDEPEDPQSAAA